MQNVSEEYKQAMKQTIRNRSTMIVAIGDVNVQAQLSAEEASGSNGIYFSTGDSVFKSDSGVTYSTLEQDYTKVDGSMLFTPREGSEAPILNNGFVSSGLMQLPASASQTNFIMLFDEVEPPLSVTIQFDEYYPDCSDFYFLWDNDQYWGWVDVPITSSKKTISTNNIPTGATKVKGLWLRGKSNTADYRRMRIKSVTMGTGVMIQPDIIESSEQTYYVSRINENLPTSDFRLNLVNYESRYDADNPDNPLAILDQGKQLVNVYYGYDIDGAGTIEWVHGGKLLSDSWSSGKHKATIMAKDVLQSNENLFIHSNYTLRVENTADVWASLMFRELLGLNGQYVIDNDLANITMDLPFCRTYPAKQALQLLANYCCKTFYFDADGVPHISSDDNTPDLEITAHDIIDDITVNKEELIKEVVVPYYSYSYVPTELVTLVDENVVIPENDYRYDQDFNGTIHGYLNVLFTDPTPMVTEDDLVVYSSNRVATLTQNVAYGEWYKITVDDDKQVYCVYEYDSSATHINTVTTTNRDVRYTPSSSNVAMIRAFVRYPNDSAITPSDVSYFEMSRVEFEAGTTLDEPTDFWWNYIDHAGTYRVRITSMGYFQFASANVKYQINDSGKSLVWDNPLIGTQERALLVAEYVGEYLKSNVNYNYKYRGNPELDCNDVILQANDFVPDMQVVVSEHKIGFNGALSGEITARRRISE